MKVANKTFYFSLILAAFILSLTFVAASATLVNPATGSSNSGTVIWNATNGTTPEFARIMNCTLWGKSASTANSSYINLGFASNVSASAQLTMVNGTFVTTAIEDANDYMFYASCYNLSSVQQNSSVNTAVIIDNTIPQAASALGPTASNTNGTIAFTSTVTGRNTTGCTLLFRNSNPGAASYAMTHSGNTCTHTLTNVAQSTYTWYVRSSDGTNTTDSAEITTLVDDGKAGVVVQNGKYVVGGKAVEEKDSGMNPLWVVIIVVAVVAIIMVARRR